MANCGQRMGDPGEGGREWVNEQKYSEEDVTNNKGKGIFLEFTVYVLRHNSCVCSVLKII